MNIDNVKKLKATLEAERALGEKAHLGFNMADVFGKSKTAGGQYEDHLNTCGSIACMVGWAFVIQHPEFADENGKVAIPSLRTFGTMEYPGGARYRVDDVIEEAKKWLGFEDKESAKEFFGLSRSTLALEHISLDDALAHLDDIIATEKYVPWKDELVYTPQQLAENAASSMMEAFSA